MNPPSIFADVQNYLNEYMAFPDAEDTGDQCLAVTLWTFHTWTFAESFPRRPWTTPYLYVHSAEKQSGKTLLIDLLETLVLNPERGADMSGAVLFRLIEEVSPTIFLDEVDTIWSGARNELLRGVLNGGYKHSGYVWRVGDVGSGGEPKKFRTFCPKLLAGIDNDHLPDTVRDRCIPIQLRRIGPDEKRSVYYSFRAEPLAEQLSAGIDGWIRENALSIAEHIPENPIPGISPRAWEIAVPLVQIARTAGIEREARETLGRLLAPRQEKDSPGVRVLREIQSLFDSTGSDRLHTDTIINHLNAEIGGGWNGKALVSRVLKPYSIESAELMTIGPRTGRGYRRFQFEDAFKRYL